MLEKQSSSSFENLLCGCSPRKPHAVPVMVASKGGAKEGFDGQRGHCVCSSGCLAASMNFSLLYRQQWKARNWLVESPDTPAELRENRNWHKSYMLRQICILHFRQEFSPTLHRCIAFHQVKNVGVKSFWRFCFFLPVLFKGAVRGFLICKPAAVWVDEPK